MNKVFTYQIMQFPYSNFNVLGFLVLFTYPIKQFYDNIVQSYNKWILDYKKKIEDGVDVLRKTSKKKCKFEVEFQDYCIGEGLIDGEL